MKVVTVVGARPQFIKASAVSRAINKLGYVQEVLVHTGQHFDDNMSQIFFDELSISKPDYNLGVSSGGHSMIIGRILEKLENILKMEMPDWIVVYGDTNSTIAGALAAWKLNMNVAHVESGLRSFNLMMPEETNRILTDCVSHILFTPTPSATQNLYNAQFDKTKIHEVGDVMFDSIMFYGLRAEQNSTILTYYNLKKDGYALATVHRQENTDCPDRLYSIFEGLQSLAETMKVVVPIHPRTMSSIKHYDLTSLTSGLLILEPLGYLDMLMLERNASIVATDSGGVQKEAYFQGVPCVTLRSETEWHELLELEWNHLAPPDEKNVKNTILNKINKKGYNSLPYGDGSASYKILYTLYSYSRSNNI